MKKLIATLLGASLVSVLAACGGGGGGAEIPDTPEGQAFEYRVGVMHAISYKVAQLRAMAMGEIPVDQEQFVKNANDTAALASMIPEGFIPNSAIEGSAALPEVWTNNADFKAKAMELQNNAQALATAAQQNGFEAAKGMVQAVGGGGSPGPRQSRARHSIGARHFVGDGED